MKSPLEKEVLTKVRPTDEEICQVCAVAARIIDEVDKSGLAEGMVVGSVARDTWVRGDRDLDIFMLFPPDLSREDLEHEGLALAYRVFTALGARAHEKYAEHPYLNATLEGLDVDLVPCYRVASGYEIRSAVDRTPFHTRYVKAHIGDYRDDVLLLKQFAISGGVYGSDQMTGGFSGYLCELLVIHYGGFHRVIQAASRWRPGTVIAVEAEGNREFHEPLIVIDPVDPGRNVAAALSLTRMADFVELCRGYLTAPKEAFFLSPAPPGITRDMVEDIIRDRGTALYALVFMTPPYIEEVVVPQLKRSEASLASLFTRHGFHLTRADSKMNGIRSMVLVELESGSAPRVRRHRGPPVWNLENAEKFLAKYLGPDASSVFAGPYNEEGVYIVEVPRAYTDAGSLLASPEVMGVGLGKHIRIALEGGWEVLKDEECVIPGFEEFVRDFLGKSSPLVKVIR
jgi:tRNA nucleotidyltransferase (CCA-adding enzyme)